MPNRRIMGLALSLCLAAGGCTQNGSTGATTADGFPNINVVPTSASAQLSAAEKAALLNELAATRARQAAGDNSPATAAEIQRLRQLARLHAADALREIEGDL